MNVWWVHSAKVVLVFTWPAQKRRLQLGAAALSDDDMIMSQYREQGYQHTADTPQNSL